MKKKLYRSLRDRKLAGVCGGIANYLNMDATVIRVLWAVLSLFWYVGIAAYVICVFLIPEEPSNIIDAE